MVPDALPPYLRLKAVQPPPGGPWENATTSPQLFEDLLSLSRDQRRSVSAQAASELYARGRMLRSRTARSDGRDQTMTTTPDLFTPATKGPSAKGRNGKTPAGKRNGNGKTSYDESMIRTLSSLEHIRLRTGMYIGRLGDGSDLDDGIYVLLKEVIDNAVDEFITGNGRKVDVQIKDNRVRLRDYGSCIALV